MNKIVALAFVVIGVILIIFGGDAYVSTVGGVSRALTGAPSDTAVWLLIAGLLAAITGIFGFTGDHSKQA
jgi:hypothetical protein